MDSANGSSIASPRIVKGAELLLFGINQRYSLTTNAGIPSQWDRFLKMGVFEFGKGDVAYGVLHNHDNAGNFDYLCGVPSDQVPEDINDLMALTIPAQTYAVFEHVDHVSKIGASWKAIWNGGLQSSGRVAAKGPQLERYPENFDGRSGLGGIEIWIPVSPVQ